jgi:hypothetical protein
MSRTAGRTDGCGRDEARRRLSRAKEFIDVAELVGDESDPGLDYAASAASLAVLAGIAASDCACCATLGLRSRSQNHRDAAALLEEIPDGGSGAARQLRGLLDLKDTANYGIIAVGPAQMKRALRQARHLIEFGQRSLLR